MLRYLTNSSQWKKINNLYPDLGKEEEIFGLDLPVMEWIPIGLTQKKERSKTSKKRSILFDLPYWSDLDVKHYIDVIHVEKNVYDSVIDTLLNI